MEALVTYSERERVRNYRFEELVKLGMNPVLATDLSRREDVGMAEVRKLLRRGATPELAYRILS